MRDTHLASDFFVIKGDRKDRTPDSSELFVFEKLHADFKPLVHAVVLARVPYDDVEDVVQEVFVSAYRGLQNLRDKESAGPWLATIARNKSVEYYRKKRVTEELPEKLETRQRYDDEAVEALEAIKSLPEAYRETLLLRLVEGMTGAEIARITGMTKASVRVNLHRGMRKLRKKLGVKV